MIKNITNLCRSQTLRQMNRKNRKNRFNSKQNLNFYFSENPNNSEERCSKTKNLEGNSANRKH